MWSMGNEVYYGGSIPTYITSTMSQLVPFVHALDKDNSRPVLHACNVQDAAGYVNLAKIQDNFAGINYGDAIYGQIHSLNPNVLIMGTENDPYTIAGTAVPTWFSVRNTPYVVGHHIWTALDYLGEEAPLGSAYGYLDNCVFRKAYFYYQQAQWLDSPMVHIAIGNGAGTGRSMPPLQENWNQSGSVGVVTYTNCDSVTLYVNSTKIGTEKLSSFPKDMIMQWNNVPWQSGVIKAVGMKGGAQVVDSIKTVGPEAKVMLKSDRTALYADGDDVSCIEVSVGDANDNFVYTAVDQVSFTMTGAGRSLGIASGDWSSSEPFKATSRKLYKGKVLIVIQSTTTPGTINVTVSAAGLTPASLTLTTTGQPVQTIKPGAPLIGSRGNSAGQFTCSQNPGTKNVRVKYRVDVPGAVNLSVISPTGRTIHCLTNKYHKAGTYYFDWNPMNKSGVFFFVLKTNSNRMVRKEFLVQ
jgi:hypothetical protein